MLKIHTINSGANPENNKPRIKSLPGEEMIQSWMDEVLFWQEEIFFYNRFLTMGLGNVPHELRPEIDQLSQEFESYHAEIIPAFIKSMEELMNREEIEAEVSQAVVGKLHKHRSNLRALKMRLFPLFSELFHCEIR
ncbi:MAG: hypothetical protein CMN32_05985 [Saprospirales bacterium]|nr:hypothetical protein [Saprospirales bacterium]